MTFPTSRLTPEQSAIVAKNAPLVKWFVSKRIRQFPHLEHIREDMFQEGMLAMCRSVVKHNPDLGKFSTYVMMYLNVYVREYERTACNPVSAPGRNRHAGQGAGSAVFVQRAEMPLHDPAETPAPDEDLDAADLYARAEVHMEREAGERNGRLFMRVCFGNLEESTHRAGVLGPTATLAKELGVSRERVRQLVRRGQKTFDAWAAGIRDEAA